MKISKEGMQKHMPLIGMIFTQFIYTAMFMLSKAAISSGMKSSIFVAYRQAIATLALAPFAYFYERNNSPPLTWYLLFKIFLVSTCGITLTLDLHYAGFNYVTATFATASTNIIPAMVFVFAVCFRMEKLKITEKEGIAKVLGSILGLSGAMVYTFYKGPPLYSGYENKVHESLAKALTKGDWIKGSLLMISSALTWALWLIMQTPILKEYPAKMRLTMLQCGFSCITSTTYAAATERNIASWKLGWDVNLFSVAYCGIIVTSISYTVQVWAVEKRGPVFAAAFSPLTLVLTAIFSALIFHDSFHLGSFVGGVLLIIGLYLFLSGKNREVRRKELNQSSGDEPNNETPKV